MNDNVKLWIDALRSGEYEQGNGALTKDLDGKEVHCCLGVACKKYQEVVGDLDIIIVGEGLVQYDGDTCELPEKVVTWLGINTPGGEYLLKEDTYTYSLITDNDNEGLTFDEIADIIEQDPPELFQREQ